MHYPYCPSISTLLFHCKEPHHLYLNGNMYMGIFEIDTELSVNHQGLGNITMDPWSRRWILQPASHHNPNFLKHFPSPLTHRIAFSILGSKFPPPKGIVRSWVPKKTNDISHLNYKALLLNFCTLLDWLLFGHLWMLSHYNYLLIDVFVSF